MQMNLFDYARQLMDIRGTNKFYNNKKTPKDVVESGIRNLNSKKATSLRSKAFSDGEILDQLNSPTYCKDVDAYVPFWWAVSHYPESMFSDWQKRITMAAALQKQQYVFQTTAQVYIGGGIKVDDADLVEPDQYMEVEA
jgi:hypothetical protein